QAQPGRLLDGPLPPAGARQALRGPRRLPQGSGGGPGDDRAAAEGRLRPEHAPGRPLRGDGAGGRADAAAHRGAARREAARRGLRRARLYRADARGPGEPPPRQLRLAGRGGGGEPGGGAPGRAQRGDPDPLKIDRKSGARVVSTMPPKKILVVDDEPEVRKLMEHFLTSKGYDVRIAENGRVGLAALDSFRPDLV